MIFETSTLLSGLTASSGRMTALFALLTGISINLGQIISNAQIISCVSFCAGRLIDNANVKLPPNIFTLLFGANSYQDFSFLILDKNDLTGLTPNSNNTIESLLVGLIYRNIINGGIFTPKIDFNYWGYSYSDTKKVDTITINFYTLIASNDYELADYTSIVNPNNY